MTTEEIKNECIRRGEYTISKFTPERANAQIAFYAMGILLPIFLLLIFFVTPLGDDISEAPMAVRISLLILDLVLFAVSFFILKELRKILTCKNDTITFDKRGISYNGSDERMPERLFNLKWSEISNIDIEEQMGRGVSFNYVIRTTNEKEYKINNLMEGRDFAVNDFMWLTNFFSGKEVFNSEKMEKLSERCQPTISWFLMVLACIASMLLTSAIAFFDTTKGMIVELVIANIYIAIPLFVIPFITIFALEFMVAKRKDSRYQLLSMRSFVNFAFCYGIAGFLTLALLIYCM
ncbi:MAG: hypothetical protein IJY67_08955 [Paludibacteraceae bacterium]|nr:hypothetical protein [Paludibacteraceae bacterium]